MSEHTLKWILALTAPLITWLAFYGTVKLRAWLTQIEPEEVATELEGEWAIIYVMNYWRYGIPYLLGIYGVDGEPVSVYNDKNGHKYMFVRPGFHTIRSAMFHFRLSRPVGDRKEKDIFITDLEVNLKANKKYLLYQHRNSLEADIYPYRGVIDRIL